MSSTLTLDLPRFEEFPEEDQKVVVELLELAYLNVLFGLQVEGKRRLILEDLGQKTRLLREDDLAETIRHYL